MSIKLANEVKQLKEQLASLKADFEKFKKGESEVKKKRGRPPGVNRQIEGNDHA